jgi:hypothetical protein
MWSLSLINDVAQNNLILAQGENEFLPLASFGKYIEDVLRLHEKTSSISREQHPRKTVPKV